LNCHNCHRDISIQDAIYCPFCGIDLVQVKKRTGFSIAAGVFTIIASCIALFPSILVYISSISYANMPSYTIGGYFINYISLTIFGTLSFCFGITGGIFIFKRKHFAFAILGPIFNILTAAVTIIAIPVLIGLFFGAPIMISAIIGIVFIAFSRKEFS
jgi:hypothetical protein